MTDAAATAADDDDLVTRLMQMPADERMAFIDTLSVGEAQQLLDEMDRAAALEHGAGVDPIELLPHQVPPGGDWRVWVLAGGRGSAKSFAGGYEFTRHLLMDEPCIPSEDGGHRGIIIAPTMGDAIESCVNGPSGVKRMAASMGHEARLRTTAGGVHVLFDTGAEVKLTGAYTPEDVERLRAAGNRCACWAEELAAWRQHEAWEHATLGVRLGPRPRFMVTTTPKPMPLYKDLMERARKSDEDEWETDGGDLEGLVVVTHATTADNPHLDEHVKGSLYARYGGTRLGRQELEGELVEDVIGALWTTEMIEQSYKVPDAAAAARLAQVTGQGVASWGTGRTRLPTLDDCKRVAVGVDPPGGATVCGIVAVGLVTNCPCLPTLRGDIPRAHLVVLADGSLGGGGAGGGEGAGPAPAAWARRVQWVHDRVGADKIAVERNYGGDMVEHTLRTLPHGPSLPIEQVQATRGKRIRAEPLAAMYEQMRVHHVPLPDQSVHLDKMEEEMMTWTDDARWSPNRLDALVWAAAQLMPSLRAAPVSFSGTKGLGRSLGALSGVGPGSGAGAAAGRESSAAVRSTVLSIEVRGAVSEAVSEGRPSTGHSDTSDTDLDLLAALTAADEQRRQQRSNESEAEAGDEGDVADARASVRRLYSRVIAPPQ